VIVLQRRLLEPDARCSAGPAHRPPLRWPLASR